MAGPWQRNGGFCKIWVIHMERKTLAQRFEENYAAVRLPAANRRGYKVKYVYYKPWYVWRLPAAAIKRDKLLFALMFTMQLLLFFCGSLQDDEINLEALVGMPLVLSVIALIFEMLGVVQFCAVRRRMTEQNYYDIDRKIKRSTPAYACLLCAAAAACVYCMICRPFSLTRLFIVVCYFGSAGLAVLIRARYTKIPFATEENDNLEQYDMITPKG